MAEHLLTCCTKGVKDYSVEANPACSELHALRVLQVRGQMERSRIG